MHISIDLKQYSYPIAAEMSARGCLPGTMAAAKDRCVFIKDVMQLFLHCGCSPGDYVKVSEDLETTT